MGTIDMPSHLGPNFQHVLDPDRPQMTREELLAEQVIALRNEIFSLRHQIVLLQAELTLTKDTASNNTTTTILG